MSQQENPSSLRLQILACHLAASPQNMASEKEAVLKPCSCSCIQGHSSQAPTHIQLIPEVRDGLTGISKAEEKHCEILGRLLYTAKLVAKQEGLEDGFRLVINKGLNRRMIDI